MTKTAKRIRKLRQELGLTLHEMGERLGMSYTTISRKEHGESDFTASELATLVEVAAEHGIFVSLDDLVLGGSKSSLSEDERLLVAAYRQADETGKLMIRRVCAAAGVKLD